MGVSFCSEEGRGWFGYCLGLLRPSRFSWVPLKGQPASQLVYKAPVLAAIYQGKNLPISILSAGCLRELCHNPSPPPRRKAPLSSCSSSSLVCPRRLFINLRDSITDPSLSQEGGTFPVVGEHHCLGKKVLSELGLGHGYPQPLASQLLVMGIGVPAVDSVLQCLAVFPALIMGFNMVAF